MNLALLIRHTLFALLHLLGLRHLVVDVQHGRNNVRVNVILALIALVQRLVLELLLVAHVVQDVVVAHRLNVFLPALLAAISVLGPELLQGLVREVLANAFGAIV